MRQFIRHTLPLLVAALLFFASPHEATAQQQENSQRNDVNLPAWSEPQARQQRADRSTQPQTEETDPPPPPPQVPVDGGLGLLAAAGVAYAVSRLRRKGEGDGEEDGTDALP